MKEQCYTGHSITRIHRSSRTFAERGLASWLHHPVVSFHSSSASSSLRNDVGVVTAHEIALSDLGLLLLQHCVQVLVPCTSHNTL